MAVRLLVTFHAASGEGTELVQAMKARCEVSRQDAGCEQLEVFQSVSDPDKLVLPELWKDQAALDTHANCRRINRPCPKGCGSAPASARTIPYNGTPLNVGDAKPQVSVDDCLINKLQARYLFG
jgi:quinol monooxygenase YgiN